MGHIYWVLVGPQETPSSRIHGLRIHEFLVQRGWQSHVLFEPPYWMWDPPLVSADFVARRVFRPGDAVICQKIRGPNTLSILEGLGSLGVATLYVDCDLPCKIEEARSATMTVCSSGYLANEYRKGGLGAVYCIPDAYEWSLQPKRGGRLGKLRCVWFGNTTPEKWAEVENIRELIAASSKEWSLVRISDHPASEVKWGVSSAWRLIAQCDAAIIPGSDAPWALAKSSNKAVQAMALGLPVVAYPTPAHREVIRPGRNGLLCRTDYEWISAFHTLENQVERLRMSLCAYRFARRYFSIERIGRIWEATLARCGVKPPRPARAEHDVDWEADFQDLQRIVYARSSVMLRNRVRFG